MTKNLDIITKGQASCLVLSLPPTEKNRAKAKQIFKESSFAVTYIKGTDQHSPIAIGKKSKKLNPFKYLSYPSTPPSITEEPIFKDGETLLDKTESLFDKDVTISDEDEPMSDNDESASVNNETLNTDTEAASDNDDKAEFDNDESETDDDKSVYDADDHPTKEEEDESDNKLRYPEEENLDCNVKAGKTKSHKPRMIVESVPPEGETVEEEDTDINLRKEYKKEKDCETNLDEMEDNALQTEEGNFIINNLKVKNEHRNTTLEENNLFHFDDSYDFDNCVYDDDASVDEQQEETESAVDNDEVYNNEENNDEENNIEEAAAVEENDVEYLNIRETTVESNEDSAVEEVENPVQVKSKSPKTKRANLRILKSAVLNFSKKIFSKKTPELPEKYDYIFVSSADMLNYVKKYIDTGDLTSKRFQYWLTKSNALNGKIDIVDLGDGQSLTGRYLYVLKPQFSKHVIRQQQQLPSN